jgi:phosphoribosylaminoimidazolecarboxamide formyltransferase/IMP cyclohydrolase
VEFQVRTVPGGFLAQTPDRRGFDPGACTVVSRRQPTEAEWAQLEFAWLAAKHVKSNAIVIARDLAAVGVGAGQMSRVEAVELAVRRAGNRARGGVLASDAFFPFPDGPAAALQAGVTAIIQPGGSVRDKEVLAAVNGQRAAMVLTGERHFRH